MPARSDLNDADWFWRKVDRSGECWIWQGATDPHGYGKVIYNQEPMKAHYIAWFLVMGHWPKDGLFRTCAIRKKRSQARWYDGSMVYADEQADAERLRSRLCVRPHHMRDGLGENARSRWAKDAQDGWPPEFRSVTDNLLSTAQAQSDLMPLVLYQGAMSVGRAQALFNWTMAAQAAEAARLGDVLALSKAWPDMSHAVGLHKPVTAASTMGQFWGRMLDNPETLRLRPGMKDYVQSVLVDSGYRPVLARRIDRYSPWSSRSWRSNRQPAPGPMPEVWPFIPESTGNIEHDLVAAVDAAVTKRLPEIVRQDVCQDLILAVLEGEVRVEDLHDASERFIKGVFRQYPTKYGPLSLDAPLGSESAYSLIDTLADAPLILGGEHGSLAELRDALEAQEAAA